MCCIAERLRKSPCWCTTLSFRFKMGVVDVFISASQNAWKRLCASFFVIQHVDAQATEQGLSSADRRTLSQHVHACCTATMHVQAATLDFDMSTHTPNAPSHSDLPPGVLPALPTSFQVNYNLAQVQNAYSNHTNVNMALKEKPMHAVHEFPISGFDRTAVAQVNSAPRKCMQLGSAPAPPLAAVPMWQEAAAAGWQPTAGQCSKDAFMHGVVSRCDLFTSRYPLHGLQSATWQKSASC